MRDYFVHFLAVYIYLFVTTLAQQTTQDMFYACNQSEVDTCPDKEDLYLTPSGFDLDGNQIYTTSTDLIPVCAVYYVNGVPKWKQFKSSCYACQSQPNGYVINEYCSDYFSTIPALARWCVPEELTDEKCEATKDTLVCAKSFKDHQFYGEDSNTILDYAIVTNHCFACTQLFVKYTVTSCKLLTDSIGSVTANP